MSRTLGGFSLPGPISKLQFVISLRTADRLFRRPRGTYFTAWILTPTRKHSAPGLDGWCLRVQYRAQFRHFTSDYQKMGRQSTWTGAPGTIERTNLVNGRVPGSIGRTKIGPILRLLLHFPEYLKQRMTASQFFSTFCVWVSLASWHKDMCRLRSGLQ